MLVVCTGQFAASSAPQVLPGAGRGTVLLLFLLMGHPGLWAHEDSAPDFRVFEFRCGFNLPVGSGHIDRLMASEGARRRIAIYWIEPTMFCEAEAFVRYSDFIFDGEAVNYWIHGMTRPAALSVCGMSQGDLSLPEQETPESVVRSAFSVVSRLRGVPRNGDIPLEVDTFFVRSRDQPQYNYDAFSDATVGSWPVAGANSVARVLNASCPSGGNTRRTRGPMERWSGVRKRARKVWRSPP